MHHFLLLLCFTSGIASSAFQVFMIADVFDRLVDRTHERLEEIEILTIEGGLEKTLLLENGITSSSVSAIPLAEQTIPVIARLRTSEAGSPDRMALYNLVTLADEYVNTLTNILLIFPTETEKLLIEFNRQRKLLDSWKVWMVQYQETMACITSEMLLKTSCISTERSTLGTIATTILKNISDTLEKLLSELTRSEGILSDQRGLKNQVTTTLEMLKDFNELLASRPRSSFINLSIVAQGHTVTEYLQKITAALPNTFLGGQRYLVHYRRMIDMETSEFLYVVEEFDRLSQMA